tara:strand:- start:78 stop:287 length:210 start_codon:yes stop_codon:yes gene_type:complete
MKKLIDGQYIEMTAEEITARESQIATDEALAKTITDAQTQRETDKASGKAKLKELGLTDAQIKALMGVE